MIGLQVSSSSSGEIKKMCQAILKAFTVKENQTIVIRPAVADWIKASGMSNFRIVYQCG